MKMKTIMTALVLGGMIVGSWQSVQADEKTIKDQIAAVNKELGPIQRKAVADPDVKAAADAVKAAQDKYNTTLEAAMIKADPKAKELLDQRKKLQEELNAALKAAKPAPPAKTPPPAKKN